jgi:hypothetical protein
MGESFIMFPRTLAFDARLSHGAKCVYAALVAYSFDGQPARISLNGIADLLRYEGKATERRLRNCDGAVVESQIGAVYSRKTVRRWIAELVDAQYVKVIPGRQGARNSYELTMPSVDTGCVLSGKIAPLPRAIRGKPQVWDRSYPKVGPLTKLHTINNSRNVGTAERKKVEASDEFLTLHQTTTGWTFPVVAQDLAKALGTVGKENETTLFAHYKYAVTQPSIKSPLPWAIKQTKLTGPS